MSDSNSQLVFSRIKALNDIIILNHGEGFVGDGSKITNIQIADGTIEKINLGDGVKLDNSNETYVDIEGKIITDDSVIKTNLNQIITSETNFDNKVYLNKNLNISSNLSINTIKSNINLNNSYITNVLESDNTSSLINRNQLETNFNDNLSYFNNILNSNTEGNLLNTNALDMNSNSIENIADPINNNDAINFDFYNANKLSIGDNSSIAKSSNDISIKLASNSGFNLNNNGISLDTDFSQSPLKIPSYYGFSLPK